MAEKGNKTQRINIIHNYVEDDLTTWINEFIFDRRSQNMATGTIYFYKSKLKLFTQYCSAQQISKIAQITPGTLRNYLLWLDDTGHNAGGKHAAYRAIKTFLLWYEYEEEPADWKNPIRKVKAPRQSQEPIEPVPIDTIAKMIATCAGTGFTSRRDKALLLFLLDTGTRASETNAINLIDMDLSNRSILIRKGKGSKPRMVFIGQRTWRTIRAYLKTRSDNCSALWVTDEQTRITYWGMNEILKRRSRLANVPKPTLHDFRRAFALNFLRNNPNEIYSLQRLMGHADLQVLRRYLAQTYDDIREAHQRGSPVDHSTL